MSKVTEFHPASRQQKLLLMLVLFVFAGLFLPFVNKAFHIDDVAFLNISRMIDWNPLVAFPSDYPYQGKLLHQFLPYELTHPFFIPYVLKIGIALFGENEIPLHLIFLIFPALSLWFLSRISEELAPGATNRRYLLLVFFCSMPAFLVNAQNLMTDVATLCFLLGGINYFLKMSRQQSVQLSFLSGIFLTLAIFSSYQALAFLPLLAAFTLVDRGLKRYRVAGLLIPVIILSLWLCLVYSRYEIFPLLASKTEGNIANEISIGLSLVAFQGKAIYLLALTGLMTLFPLVLNLMGRSVRRLQLGALLGSSLVFYLLLFSLDSYSSLEKACLAFLMACGILTLTLTIQQTIRGIVQPTDRAVNLLLLGWIAMVLAYNLFVMPFGAARYLLPLFPPLFILLLHPTEFVKRPKRIPVAVLLVCAILFGLTTAVSDYSYAGSYRKMATEVAAFKRQENKNTTFWYVGEWGMRIYFDRAGIKYLLADSRQPRAGDYIIIPEMPRFWVPSGQVQSRTTVAYTKVFSSDLPIRLFNRRSNAGFYCHLWGYLPLALSSEPDEVFTIMKVVR